MKNLRRNLPKRFYNYDVRSINDYHKGFSHNLLTGKKMIDIIQSAGKI